MYNLWVMSLQSCIASHFLWVPASVCERISVFVVFRHFNIIVLLHRSTVFVNVQLAVPSSGQEGPDLYSHCNFWPKLQISKHRWAIIEQLEVLFKLLHTP